MSLKLLITYRCETRGREIWGYEFADSAEQWLEAKILNYPDETYFLVSAQTVSNEFAEKYDGNMMGM